MIINKKRFAFRVMFAGFGLLCIFCWLIFWSYPRHQFLLAFGFSPPSSISWLKSTYFQCIDCQGEYLTFFAPNTFVDGLVADEKATKTNDFGSNQGDGIGRIIWDAPSWWKECELDADSSYGMRSGILWYSRKTGRACLGQYNH